MVLNSKRIMICRGIACCSVIDVINSSQEYLLNVDVLPIILEFLPVKEIMRSRRVCKKWEEAVRRAIAHDIFFVESVEAYNLLRAMVTALPNLQKLQLGYLGMAQKFIDGEDPDEERAAVTANWTTHDIEIISNFSKLHNLEIENDYLSSLNGRYPALFNSFPLLQKLSLQYCSKLKWDLEMLAGMPSLKELNCYSNDHLTGNINSLRVLKGTLEKVTLHDCWNVEGNFMDLADFPHLKELDLEDTAVTGDIRDIGENDFSALEYLALPQGIYGAVGYELQHISDAPDLARSAYLLKKQHPLLNMKYWYGILSEDSPDWYVSADEDNDTPPFKIRLVQVGSRIGYQWETDNGDKCQVNWLDPEPDRESTGYMRIQTKYALKIQEIESEIEFYRGFHRPPTEEEYDRLWEEADDESDNES